MILVAAAALQWVGSGTARTATVAPGAAAQGPLVGYAHAVFACWSTVSRCAHCTTTQPRLVLTGAFPQAARVYAPSCLVASAIMHNVSACCCVVVAAGKELVVRQMPLCDVLGPACTVPVSQYHTLPLRSVLSSPATVAPLTRADDGDDGDEEEEGDNTVARRGSKQLRDLTGRDHSPATRGCSC